MANRRPDAARARALELLGQGLSERDVVEQLRREGITVSKGSVGNWKKGSRPAAAGPPAPEPLAEEGEGFAAPAAPVPEDWELPDVDLVQLPAELLERLGKLYAAKIAERLSAEIIDHQLLGALLRDHERICKALVMARPPVAQDPERDPANVEMAAIAIGHVKRMIEDARRRRAQAPAPEQGTAGG